jgi:hypothetical protein
MNMPNLASRQRAIAAGWTGIGAVTVAFAADAAAAGVAGAV